MSFLKARVALCQMKVTANKLENIAKATSMIAIAKKEHNADIAVLPECWNCPYGVKFFPPYAEALPVIGSKPEEILPHADGKFPAAACLSKAALENQVWIVGGSVPELVAAKPEEVSAEGKKSESGKGKPTIYNSSMIFSPDGVLRAVHRKIHLFCIRTETVTMDEAETLTAGRSPTVVDVALSDGGGPRRRPRPTSSGSETNSQEGAAAATAGFKMGVGICFDIRFPQLASYYHDAGTSFLVYPGAFNMVTGPPHWLHAAKSRAIDAQQFVAVCSVARDTSADYVAYGHSALIDPWGEVLCEAQEGEEIVACDIDMKRLAEIRQRLPISSGTRTDLYKLQWNE